MRKLLLLHVLFACSCLYATAQTGSIQGKVFNNEKKPLPLTTITIFSAKDTSIITYRMTNDIGEFKIPNLPFNKELRLLATYSGFEAYRKNFTLTENNPSFQIDSILLKNTLHTLDEVIVVAERPPVVIKQDTIEFNANAFKTLPNALVEDLLRKLPGVRVESDGSITVNGKPVNKILVDGKSFFGDDPKMASRNLPANAIDKVQVVDDKEQALLNGDNNTSNVGKVVNITLKKGFKKGAFGKIYAGGGTQDRFEAGGIINAFRDTLQISLLGYSNNLNRPGFSYGDLMNAGGLKRSNSNRTSNSSSMWSSEFGSNIKINGVSFGGINSFGLATSNGAGFNINHAPDKNKSMYLQYYFGEVRTVSNTDRLLSQFISDTTINNRRITDGETKNYGHNLGAGIKIKTDSLTTINFNTSYTVGLQKDDLRSTITSDNSYYGSLSDGSMNQWNKTDNFNYNHSFYFLKQGKKDKKKNFIISNQTNIGTTNTDYRTNSSLNYYYPTHYDSIQYLLRSARLPQTSVTTNIIFREPISKTLSIRLNNRHRYNFVSNKTNTYYAASVNSDYNIPDSLLSGTFQRSKNDFTFYQGIQYQYKGLTITPSIGELLMYYNTQIPTLAFNQNESLQKIVESLDISYKNLSISYMKDYVLPAYSYLLPVLDNSNPYYIVKGNPNLQIAKQHQATISCNINDQKNNWNVWLWGNASQTDNDIIQQITVNQQGIQTSMPVNADGSQSFSLNYNVNKDFKLSEKNKLTLSVGGYYEINRSKMLFNGDTSWQTSAQFNNWSGIHFNFNDVFEWDNSFNPFFNFTDYSSKSFSRINITTHDFTTGIVLRYPKHIVWESNLNYTYNSSLSSDNKSLYRWTAAVNFTFMKDEKAVLKISAYDILNQNSKYMLLTANQNSLRRAVGTMMPQYFMLTFTYNIRSVGGKKQKVGGQSLFSM